MTFGEKLKEARKTIGLSQEQFAEKMNISRSAVAKWESDIGIPDVSNLKSIAGLLNVSIDFLLDTETDTGSDVCMNSGNVETNDKVETCPEYDGHYYTIELTGWNDGAFDVIILGQDNMFLYYKVANKKESFYGMIGKKYITSISKGKEIKDVTVGDGIDRTYFCGKHVKLEIAHKEGFFKGFLDMRNDDYLDVVIKKFDDKKVVLNLGNELDIDTITKIEEI